MLQDCNLVSIFINYHGGFNPVCNAVKTSRTSQKPSFPPIYWMMTLQVSNLSDFVIAGKIMHLNSSFHAILNSMQEQWEKSWNNYSFYSSSSTIAQIKSLVFFEWGTQPRLVFYLFIERNSHTCRNLESVSDAMENSMRWFMHFRVSRRSRNATMSLLVFYHQDWSPLFVKMRCFQNKKFLNT